MFKRIAIPHFGPVEFKCDKQQNYFDMMIEDYGEGDLDPEYESCLYEMFGPGDKYDILRNISKSNVVPVLTECGKIELIDKRTKESKGYYRDTTMRRLSRELKRVARLLSADWPSTVEEGGLREDMGLDPDVPLQDQASPNDVIRYFEDTDASGRGKVMFAINSNQDNDFWQRVYDGIEAEE